MPSVKARYFLGFRELLNAKEEEYRIEDGTTLVDLLLEHIPKRHWRSSEGWKKRLFEVDGGDIKFNEDGTPVLKGYYMILVNGRSYAFVSQGGETPGLKYELKDGDVIAILPPVGGG